MSTATNLLSLLNQLQVMENSLTNFMLETILKIQSLTETRVFLLLETQGGNDVGRRYCGTRELVDIFEKGRLTLKADDVEVTLDSSINSSVVEKPRLSLPQPSEQQQQQQQQRSQQQQPRKRRGANEVGEEHDSTTDAPTPAKRANRERNSVVGDDGDQDADVKKEVVEFVIGDSDDEDEQSSFSAIGLGISHSVQQQQWIESSVDDVFGASQFRPSNALSARKLEALQSIENPTAVFEKGTLENKLLSSILYDYGKELALKCPFEDVSLASAEVKSYFYGNLEQFLAHFHRFTMEKTTINQSPQSYMRNIARSGYKAAAKTAMKKRGVSSGSNGN